MEEKELFERVKAVVGYLKNVGGFFICGQSVEKCEDGLPREILICPSEGLEETVRYVRK